MKTDNRKKKHPHSGLAQQIGKRRTESQGENYRLTQIHRDKVAT